MARQIDVMVAEDEWRELGSLDELQLLERLHLVTMGFGFGGEDEIIWALTDMARNALRPLSGSLVDSSATAQCQRSSNPAAQRDGVQVIQHPGVHVIPHF